jgi:YHS domain-containing protein
MKTLITLILLIPAFNLVAQDEEIRTSNFNLKEDKYAIQGYDPVSYYISDEPEKGKNEFTSRYKGVYYRFASKENQEEFKKNPSKYEPEYGGWCAYAMADGKKVKVDPETYKIIAGKLYLFYNFNFTNTLKSWNKDENNLKNKADSAWKDIIDLK